MQVSNKRSGYDGHFKINIFDVTDPETNKTHSVECFERGDSVAALVFDSEKQTFLFTKQFRIGSQSELIEIAAGSMDKEGEQPIDALKRELMEELGIEAVEVGDDGSKHIHEIGSFFVSPGGSSERIHLFIVDKFIRKSQGGGVEDEKISTVELSPTELSEKFMNGEISDIKTAFLLQVFMNSVQGQ